MEAFVGQTLCIVVIKNEVNIPSCLRHPVQAAVDTNCLANIVVLHQVHPRHGVRENEIEPGADEFRGKAALRQIHVVDAVRDLGTEMSGWRPI